MKHFSPVLQDLVNAFKGLPGIGVKSAQRIVFNLIQHNQEKALFLSETIKNERTHLQLQRPPAFRTVLIVRNKIIRSIQVLKLRR